MICGKFLYYVENFCIMHKQSTVQIIHALNNLASQVTTGTMKTEEAQAYFLNYCATNKSRRINYLLCK